jgi:hypothetical protein
MALPTPDTPGTDAPFGSEDSGVAPAFSRRDPAFGPGAVGTSNLALEFSAGYLRLAVVDAQQTTRRWVEEFSLSGTHPDEPSLHDVRHLMSSHGVLTRNFWNSVRVLVNNQSFTLVPEVLFRKEYAVRYLELARGTSLTAEKVHFTRHPGWQAVLVFSLPTRLDDYLQGVYPFDGLRFYHQMDGLLSLVQEGRPPTGKHLVMALETSSVSLILVEENQLAYVNRFACGTPNDLVYYVLFALNELGLSPADVSAHAWGQLEEGDERYQLLSKYLPDFQIGSLPSPVPLTGAFADLPTHRFAALLRVAGFR